MAIDRVKIQDILSSQVPEYVRDDFPLLVEFLEQYYISQETKSGTFDLIQNLDQYVKVDQLYNLKTNTTLNSDISSADTTIATDVNSNFTEGFAKENGLIKIDNEIIAYGYKTETTFEDCVRGFSGISSYIGTNSPDELVFDETIASSHNKGASIQNLNVLFLQEFFKKLKRQVLPGFQDRKLYGNLNQRNFIFGANSFYQSKGTDASVEILFRALYGKEAEVIRPSEFLIRPSDADYRITKDFVVESYIGDPLDLKGRTLYQQVINSDGALSGINTITDEIDNNTIIRGSVCDVERLPFDEGQYYQISIDIGYDRDTDVEGSIRGIYQSNPKTQIINTVGAGSSIIDVDSTIGFPEKGTLFTKDINNNVININYGSKTINQFNEISTSNITNEIDEGSNLSYNNACFAFKGNDKIEVRMTSTLTNLRLKEQTKNLNVGDTINVKSIGLPATYKKATNWFYNLKTNFQSKEITQIDDTESIYRFQLFDKHFFKIGYTIRVIGSDGVIRTGNVTSVNSDFSFTAKLSTSLSSSQLLLNYTVTNLILKGDSSDYLQLRNYTTNVQNIYTKFNKDLLVASNSIPTYLQTPLNPYNKKVTFSGSASSDGTIIITPTTEHGFFTGDSVFYKGSITTTITTTPDGNQIATETINKFTNMSELVYFVKRISSTSIKLAKSKSDLFGNKFIVPAGTVTNNQLIYFDFYQKNVSQQTIYREFTTPNNQSGTFNSDPGYVGMLINGVEILNFKSPKSVYYGRINEVEIVDQGRGYDVINPPLLNITDRLGVGATGTCSVEGTLERIDISDTGYDYIDNPIVRITGGSPTRDATAKVNVSSIDHSVIFNAGAASTNVRLEPNNTIGFSTFHKFRDFERVVYNTYGSTNVTGISTNSFYYVKVVDAFTINLHKSESEAISGINTISLTGYGADTHSIDAYERKRIITNIVVTDPGEGYKNNEKNINSVGVVTSLNTINILNHNYKEKDIIRYTPGSSPISGINSNTDYFVKVDDKDTIRLFEIGVGGTNRNYYYDNDIQVSIATTGNGSLNYETINVSVEGTIGVNSLTDQDFTCKVIPVFRGSITSTDITNNGVGYGASTILNFDRQPDITFDSGSNAQLFPVVSNGKIIDIIVQNSGTGYNSPPDLEIVGVGSFAKLTPNIHNGSIVSVNIISGGIGYDQGNIQLRIEPSGVDATAVAKIQEWNVDIFANDFDNIDSDDGFLNDDIGSTNLQYGHVYAPRKIRESVYAIDFQGNTLFGEPDLKIENGIEINSLQHSPIIGWAYDGNPIYGPYGYSNETGGGIKQMRPGYELITNQTQRPPLSSFKEGFFVEDYVFKGTGDLDENNGRICVTPDFPNGVYAYFATFNLSVDTSGPFDKYKRPQFPYLIGPTFKSKPNPFNFRKVSNQTEYDIGKNDWLRNTYFNYLNSQYSGYDYIFNSDKIKPQYLKITGSSTGVIKTVGIITGGTQYQVNDSVFFDNKGTGGFGARASVSRVDGKKVNTVSIATTTVNNFEFVPFGSRSRFIGISSIPHKFNNNEFITIDGLSQYFSDLDGTYRIGVSTSNFVLTEAVEAASTTGINTFISVSGNLQYPNLVVNDILKIGNEKVKVLNIEPNRIRVSRKQESTVSSAHTSTTPITSDSNKLTIEVGSAKTTKILTFNRELYFIPSESVGIGTSIGIGIGNTLSIANPGAGISEIFVEPRQIYFPGHGLKINDKLRYNLNGGSSINYWNGIAGVANTNLTGITTLYAVPFNDNFIGVSSNVVGLGTTGKYVGVNTNTGLLYFTGIGTGDNHSFKTDLTNVITADALRNLVTVATAETHGLNYLDNINFDLKPKREITIDVRYDDFNRRIVFNPKNFTAGDINLSENTISFSNHNFKTGDRVIHTSSSPSGGLDNEGMYFVYLYKKNQIKLINNKSDLNLVDPPFVNITSTSSGTLSRINPFIEVNRKNTLRFDLSDQSLSFISNGIRYSAFEMKIFNDIEFNNRFLTSGNSSVFEVTSSGEVGITSTANLTISATENLPSILWYKFETINQSIIPAVKNELIIDMDVNAYNQIDIVRTEIDGPRTVTGIGTTTFTFVVEKSPDVLSYGSTNSESYYSTNSKSAYGPINDVRIIDPGFSYKLIPSISSIRSGFGTGALVEPDGDIGQILNTQFISDNIGFDYPNDSTLDLVAGIPEILKLDPLSSFQSIGITSGGINYLNSPKLVVIDGLSGKIVDVELEYELGDVEVTILKNTSSLFYVPPTFIPTNNSNGFSISSLTYNNTNKVVRLFLSHQFASDSEYPFEIDKPILVENISVGVGSTGSGFNSKDYEYVLFSVTGVNTNAGGSGAWVEYDLSEQIGDSGFPGNFSTDSIGKVIPKTHFPTFNAQLRKNMFIDGEKLISDNFTGRVQNWNPNNETLKATINGVASPNDAVRGFTSGSVGIIQSIDIFDSRIDVGVGATIYDGWQRNTGFLNDNLQRIPDNEYYQELSYSISSEIDLDTWNDPVSTLTHTAGFRKFSDLQIYSGASTENSAIVDTNDSNLTTIVDIISNGNLNCYADFDEATERGKFIDNVYISDEIILKNRILTDFLQSIGNRVLEIDDISSQFNSNARATPFSVVAAYEKNYNYNKIFTYVKDRTFTDERQFAIVSVLQDDEIGYMSQYASIETYPYLGYFDYASTADGWNLLFYPVKFESNIYDVTTSAINVLAGVANTSLRAFGDVSYIVGSTVDIPASTTTSIVSFGTTYRSAKLINLFVDSNDKMYGAELNIVHDGTDCYQIEMNAIDENQGLSGVGFGTFDSRIAGSNVIVDFYPSVSVALTCSTASILVSDNNTTAGNEFLDVSRVGSSYSSIAASSSPTTNIIASYADPSESAYYFVTIENTTDGEYEILELGAINSSSNEAYVEFANVKTGGNIGTIGIQTGADGIDVVYTPVANKAVQVRTYFTEMNIFDENNRETEINIENIQIDTNRGNYQGTLLDVKKRFELKHDGDNIFRRIFEGNNSSIVDISNNTITIPNHFFVSGEKVKYSNPGTGSTMAIRIDSTTFPGIGATTFLPTDIFIIKDDEAKIRLATSAENALAETPVAIGFSGVGIGISHAINSINQNAKAIVAIDNIIQSPVAPTDLTTTLDQDIIFETRFNTTGITSFISGDIIKINDEFMLIEGTGIGNTVSISVERGALGSPIGVHTTGATITKFTGNYDIRDNSINFISAPFGNIPLSTTTGDPNDRDWTGITTSSKFQGRTFMKRAAVGTTEETYHGNYVFDDISGQFTGIGKTYTLQNDGNNITGIDTSTVVLINGIYQVNQGVQAYDGDYEVIENSGISSVVFSGEAVTQGYDPNRTTLPVGGRFISVGSTEGFGYQPLVAAGGTAVISAAGTVSLISIGNSGSGYRVGLNTVYNVGVQTFSGVLPNIENIGTAVVQNGHVVSVAITNPGTGYTFTNAPVVVFDSPLSYSNVPVIYSSQSPSSNGREATIDIVVGQGSSIIDFEIVNQGYGYRDGDILTVAVGGTTGIPTNTSLAYDEFQIRVEDTYSDQFNAWSIGEFQVFDRLDSQFDGVTRSFKLTVNEEVISIKAAAGSNIEVEQTLLVFINDVLQKPNEGFTFSGGSVITFSEAPKGPVGGGQTGDTSKILFYKGSGSVDVTFTEVLKTIKVGDTLELNNNPEKGQPITLDQISRTVVGINTLDTVETVSYVQPGVTTDTTLERPVTWCKQTVDKIIDGDEIGKDRVAYEPSIFPASYLIQPVGVGTTVIHVDTVRPLFNADNEQNIRNFQNKININTQDTLVGATVTAIIGADGGVSSFGITNIGQGYSGLSTVSIKVSTPVGLGNTQAATGIGTLNASGTLVSASVITPGTGYTYTTPPVTLIQTPTLTEEDMSVNSYTGDHGIIVGFGTTTFTAGLGTQTQIIFDFYIPVDSDMRDTDLGGTAVTVSGISTGDYFTIYNSNIGLGTPAGSSLRTLYNDNVTVLGITTTFCDCVYQVEDVQTLQVNVTGVGTTSVRRIFTNVGSISTVSFGTTTITFDSTQFTFDSQVFTVYQGGISSSHNFGRFSWGQIGVSRGINAKSFNFYGEEGYAGINTSGLVTRFNPLKFNNYVP